MARDPQTTAKIPDRVSAPDIGFSRESLGQTLNAIAKKGGKTVRGDVLSCLKEQLSTGKNFVRERFEQGRLDGLETARALAAVHDGVVTALWDYTTLNVAVADGVKEIESISLCAVGGYGRCLLYTSPSPRD